jgi:hypothetical protein
MIVSDLFVDGDESKVSKLNGKGHLKLQPSYITKCKNGAKKLTSINSPKSKLKRSRRLVYKKEILLFKLNRND